MGESQSKLEDQERHCRIIVIGNKNGDDAMSELVHLPAQAKILAIGKDIDEISLENPEALQQATVIFNATGNGEVFSLIVKAAPKVVWIHTMMAGIDHLLFPELIQNPYIHMTNAKGVYSSTLAEYAMGMILHFAKNVKRLNEQKEKKIWQKFDVVEIAGKTIGIVGYGDIGVACAKLAKAFRMNVVALRRHPNLSAEDPLVDEVYPPDQLVEVVKLADYLVISAPLTPETVNMFDANILQACKPGQILINIGRGKLIVESALIDALENGPLGGAALDVFATEPLPETSKLWELPNVVISPHNADQTVDFRHQSTRLFCDNCQRFLEKQPLHGIVNKQLGY